jgi:hypothetical protein
MPCIGSNALTDIVFNCPGLLDRANLNLSKVDLQFVGTNASRVQIKGLAVIKGTNPDRFLIRYQFLEILVRLARERHFIPGIKGKTTAATSKTALSDQNLGQIAPIMKVD